MLTSRPVLLFFPRHHRHNTLWFNLFHYGGQPALYYSQHRRNPHLPRSYSSVCYRQVHSSTTWIRGAGDNHGVSYGQLGRDERDSGNLDGGGQPSCRRADAKALVETVRDRAHCSREVQDGLWDAGCFRSTAVRPRGPGWRQGFAPSTLPTMGIRATRQPVFRIAIHAPSYLHLNDRAGNRDGSICGNSG